MLRQMERAILRPQVDNYSRAIHPLMILFVYFLVYVYLDFLFITSEAFDNQHVLGITGV